MGHKVHTYCHAEILNLKDYPNPINALLRHLPPEPKRSLWWHLRDKLRRAWSELRS